MARVLAALLGVAVLGLAGCGGGNEKQSLVATGGNPVLTVPITIEEHLVSPQYTRLSIPGTYTLQIENEGSVAHAVTIEHKGRTLVTPTIAPGQNVRGRASTSPIPAITSCRTRSAERT